MARSFSPLRTTLALAVFGLSGAAFASPDRDPDGMHQAPSVEAHPVTQGAARGEGKAKGHAKGKARGKAKGHAKGEARGKAKGHAKGKAKGQALQTRGPRKGGGPVAQGGGRSGQAGQSAAARPGKQGPGRGIGERPQAELPGKRTGAQRPDLRPRQEGRPGGVVERPDSPTTEAPRGPRPHNPKEDRPQTGARPGFPKADGPGRGAPRDDNAHQGEGSPRKPLVVHRHAMLPKLWAPSYHRTGLKGVSPASPEYWSRGIFVYSPPPSGRDVVVVQHMGQDTQVLKQEAAPTRAVDRRRSLALGALGGSYYSGTPDGQSYGDLGLGLLGRFRATESLGVEFAWTHHDQGLTQWTDRANNPMQLSAQLFAFPWTRVSPYVTAGYTWNNRSLADQWTNETTGQQIETVSKSTLRGPHAGLGLEFAIGQSAALGLDLRYIRWMGQEANDPTSPNALRGTAGLTFYF